MKHLAWMRQGVGAAVIGLSLTLGVLGPAAAPAQAAGEAVVSGSADASASSTSYSGTPAALSGTQAARNKRPQLSLTQVTPTSLTFRDDLVVTGAVTNPGNGTVRNLDIDLRFSYQALTSRDAVTKWVEEGDVATTSATLDQVTVKNLAPGATSTFTFTLPAGTIGLSGFGPRPFSLVAVSGQGRQLDVLRSTVVWAPPDTESKVGLSLLAALTSTTPSTTAGLPTEEAAAELMPSGRLSRVLGATQDPAVGWAVDPALLASAQALRDGGITEESDQVADPTPEPAPASATPSQTQGQSPGPTAGNSEVTDLGITDESAATLGENWLNRISAGRNKRTVFGLPYADTDLNSTLKGGKSSGLLRQSDKLGESIEKAALGKTLASKIAWPADGQISDQAIEGLAETRHAQVILSADQQRPEGIDYTPSGKSTLRSNDETLTGLLYDEQLSDLFAGSGKDSGAETTQQMLATLAAISAETTPDNDTRQLLAVAPRNWDPSPRDVQRLTSALREASWVQMSSLKNLGAAGTVDREDHRYGKKAAGAELPKGNLSTAQAMDRSLDSIAPALINNAGVARRLEQRIASLLSYAWRSDLEAQASGRRSVSEDLSQLTEGVQLLIGSESRIFTARSAPLQVVVDNKTNYDVRVSVNFRAASGQLKIVRQPDTVTIAAQHRQTFRVDARAIATGDVQVETTLLAGEGATERVVGTPLSFEVKVRPNWESWGIIGMAVILGLLLLVGLLRSFRRNRKRPKVPLNTIPDVDDEATRAARKAAKQAAAEREALTSPVPRADAGPGDPPGQNRPEVTEGSQEQGSGGATNRTQQGSTGGGDAGRTPGPGSASGTREGSRGMHDQNSSSVPTMTARGAERRSPTMPKETR